MQEFNPSHQDPSTTTTRTATSAAAMISQSSHGLKQTFDHSHSQHHPSSHPSPQVSFEAETRQAIVTVLQSYRIHIAVIFRRLLGNIINHKA